MIKLQYFIYEPYLTLFIYAFYIIGKFLRKLYLMLYFFI